MPRIKKDTKGAQVNKSHQGVFYELLKVSSAHKKLPFEDIVQIFQTEIQRALNKSYDPDAQIEIRVDHENSIARIINLKGKVIDDLTNSNFEQDEDKNIYFIDFLLSQVPEDKRANYQPGSEIEIEFKFDDLGERSRKAILSGFKQESRLLERSRVKELFGNKIGEKFFAKVNTTLKHEYDIDIFYNNEAFRALLPKKKTPPRKTLNPGADIRVILEKVNLEKTATPLEVTMLDKNEIKDTLTKAIVEIQRGDLEIVRIRRKYGIRSKVAVRVNPERKFDFDIIGSIFGQNAQRINDASKAIGESIDIIRYSNNKKEFISNSLSPVVPVDILVTKDHRAAFAIVKDEDITRAIGKDGINIELASKLTGIKIKVKSIQQANELNLPYNKEKLKETQSNKLLDKQLFKATKPKLGKRSQAQELLDVKEMKLALSNFSDDLQSFIDNTLNTPEQDKTTRKTKTQSPKNDDINNLFYNLTNEMKDSDQSIESYEDLMATSDEEQWEYIFNPSFADENEVFDDENFENNESKTSGEPVNENPKKAKNLVQVYKGIKDFKVDSDLASYGLSENLDFGDLEDENW